MLIVQHPKEETILYPILRDSNLCFVLCLLGSHQAREDMRRLKQCRSMKISMGEVCLMRYKNTKTNFIDLM